MKYNQFSEGHPNLDVFTEGRHLIEELEKFKQVVKKKTQLGKGRMEPADYIEVIIKNCKRRYDSSKQELNNLKGREL